MNVQTVAVFAAFFGIVTSAASVSSDSASWEEPDEISVGTWNSFDIIFAPDREIRRNYVFSNADNLFGDLDILCSQEAFSPNAISEFTSAFNFDYEFGSPDSPLLEQSCPDDVVNEIADPGGRLYECTQSCKGSLLTSGVSWIFCIYLTCFSSLIDTSSGVTNRTIDPQLFDIGKQLDLSACGGCLWQSWYVENDFETNQGLTSDEALEKLLDRCQSDPQNVNYKVNPGIILYSNIKANKVCFYLTVMFWCEMCRCVVCNFLYPCTKRLGLIQNRLNILIYRQCSSYHEVTLKQNLMNLQSSVLIWSHLIQTYHL